MHHEHDLEELFFRLISAHDEHIRSAWPTEPVGPLSHELVERQS